jgi:D-alanyl-lipoteichoic acid acyltransferase DltB (MBOAT superfamily)
MLFNTLQFALFFGIVLAGYRAAPRAHRSQWLIAMSLLFYFLWIPAYLLLLLADLWINYQILRAMLRSQHKRAYLIASLVMSLGILGYFKYARFFVQSTLPLLRAGFGLEIPLPDVLLPLGISFFTFQLLALAIDAYRGGRELPETFAEYLLFLSFFPQLVAGPILRGRQLLPQLRRGGERTAERSRRGVWLLTSGLAKKVILADFLLAPFVNEIFASPGDQSAAYHWVAIYSFAFQIYFDFSGYSDMARGLALLLGFELPLNFKEPYLSRNPNEFWQRWHITLSNWLRDYLYISLGGNRVTRLRTQINLMITMLLGGLWHGAAWNFVLWGGLHGLLLAGHRFVRSPTRTTSRPLAIGDAWRIILCFHAVCLIWVFFRAENLGTSIAFLGGLFDVFELSPWPEVQTLIVVLCAGLHFVERIAREKLPEIRSRLSRPLGGVLEGTVIGVVWALSFATAGRGGEFIYFQF